MCYIKNNYHLFDKKINKLVKTVKCYYINNNNYSFDDINYYYNYYIFYK